MEFKLRVGEETWLFIPAARIESTRAPPLAGENISRMIQALAANAKPKVISPRERLKEASLRAPDGVRTCETSCNALGARYRACECVHFFRRQE